MSSITHSSQSELPVRVFCFAEIRMRRAQQLIVDLPTLFRLMAHLHHVTTAIKTSASLTTSLKTVCYIYLNVMCLVFLLDPAPASR